MNPVLASDPTIPDFLSPMHIYVLKFLDLARDYPAGYANGAYTSQP
jgi:hypothetical protein